MSQPASDPHSPKGIDLSKPSVARIYDYILGGTANWAIDREFADRMLANFPVAKDLAIANRLFLHRAVRRLARLGVRQFVDIGSGVPTMGHTHTVADEVSPGCRVVYVDNEPVAVAHSRILLEQHGDLARHAAIQGDLRDADRLWSRVAETGVIDPRQPVALLMIAVLHFAQPGPDGTDIGADAVARYRKLLPSGSYLAISHACLDGAPPVHADMLAQLKVAYDGAGNELVLRARDDIRGLFGDFELVDPGMAWAPAWHPEDARLDSPEVEFASPNESVVYVGVGRKA
ncbi:MAG TPA: SAM-dependent methyltransferase [Pseudonocardiaceae bacterium]|nr:SAM-dependent methyltransferase [Pseudonocardiaceae bacterium]